MCLCKKSKARPTLIALVTIFGDPFYGRPSVGARGNFFRSQPAAAYMRNTNAQITIKNIWFR